MARSPIGENARLYVFNQFPIATDFRDSAGAADYSKTDGTGQDTVSLAMQALGDAGTAGTWMQTCPVDVSFTGGTETADDSDRCNADSTVVTKTTYSINFNFKKRKNLGGQLPEWAKLLRRSWSQKEVIGILMIDTPELADASADGFWMLAAVTDYAENQPLTESIDISITVVPGSTPSRATAPFVPFRNRDIFRLS